MEENEPWWVPENDRKGAFRRNNTDDFIFLNFTIKKDIEVEYENKVKIFFENLKEIKDEKWKNDSSLSLKTFK